MGKEARNVRQVMRSGKQGRFPLVLLIVLVLVKVRVVRRDSYE
jgi:hypothetical protein